MAAHYAAGFWEAVPSGASGESRAASILGMTALTADSSVIEIGCGRGDILADLHTATGCSVLGIEPSPVAAAQARTAIGNVIVGGWQDIPTGTTADLIVLSHVLEHLYEPDAALQAIRAHLNANGSLYVEVPNILAPNKRKRLSGWLTREHLWYFSPATLTSLLQRNGFKVVQSRHDHAVRLLAVSDASVVPPMPHERRDVWRSIRRHELAYWPWYVARRIGLME